MERWKVCVRYDGSCFHGFQRQGHELTVQGVLEEAILRFSGERVCVFGSGRTDAGVHARGQVIHFDLEKTTTADTLLRALNYFLPSSVSVFSASSVSEDFHARFSSVRRVYIYYVWMSRYRDPFWARRSWQRIGSVHLDLMRQESRALWGYHDFSSLRAAGCGAMSAMKTLDYVLISAPVADLFVFEVSARSFLYHQVRNIVGTLIGIGEGRIQKSMHEILEARDRSSAGVTAPAHGLFFQQVYYDFSESEHAREKRLAMYHCNPDVLSFIEI